MANSFSKEERIAFELLLEGFQDQLVLSRNVSIYNTDQVTMERTNDVIWRPMPYISQSFDGMDQTSNFKQYTQLSVPATLGYKKSVPWTLSATELRDALQEQRLGQSARQKLASDINVAVMNVTALQGSLVVKQTTAAAGFDDVALADSRMNEEGVDGNDRYMALSSRDYNSMASNLAGRQTLQGKPLTAYEKAYIGTIAGFETYKMDYAYRLPAAAGGSGLTINTTVAGAQYYTPKATTTATTGEVGNVDNRFQQVTISSTTNVATGDAFTIAGIYSVHHITKQATNQLKTFRVISVDSSTTMTITPPLITGQGGTDAELQYQNCSAATTSTTAAIVFQNTTVAYANPFWHRDAVELLPGRYAVPTDAGTAVLRASTDQGIELVMQKFYDINTMTTKYRLDTLFGVVMKNTEMCGIELFGQS